MDKKNRNIAIDFLKVFAVFLVMNSHMGICYPKYGFIATGGAIGDALFFFASGFTLFLGRDLRFDNWYKRRINRIFPSLIATAIITCIVWNNAESIVDIIIGKKYWFIGCILIYYVLLYLIKKYVNIGKINIIMATWGVILVALYFLFFNNGIPFYGEGYFRCFMYFIIMLQGATMGVKQDKYKFKVWHPILLLISIIAWYTLFYFTKNSCMILFSIIPLMGATKYFYLTCCYKPLSKIYEKKYIGNIIFIISQLCLESYLIQKYIFNDQLNYLFPLNIPIIMLCVLLAAYIIKTLSNFILQTFASEPYDWGKMLLRKSRY